MTLSMGLITVLSHLELAQIRISMLRLDSSKLSAFWHRFGGRCWAHLFLGWKSPNSKDKSGTGAVNAFKIYYTWFKNTTPKRNILVPRSIVKFDLIWYQTFELKIAMATLRRHRFNETYLPAHCLLRLLFWLHSTLQHMCQHDIVKTDWKRDWVSVTV